MESELFKTLQASLNKNEKEVFSVLIKNGTLCLVGGSVRDALSTDQWGHDFDIEYRPDKPISEILNKLHEQGLIESWEELPFYVYRPKVKNCARQLEISLPRADIYPEGINHNLGHSDFSSSPLCENSSYTQSFKRRDLTINAIGLELSSHSGKLIDPYNGIDDLRHKLIRPVDEKNFYKDPVRTLRALRFFSNLGSSKGLPSLNFEKICLRKLAFTHLCREYRKALNHSALISAWILLLEKLKKEQRPCDFLESYSNAEWRILLSSPAQKFQAVHFASNLKKELQHSFLLWSGTSLKNYKAFRKNSREPGALSSNQQKLNNQYREEEK